LENHFQQHQTEDFHQSNFVWKEDSLKSLECLFTNKKGLPFLMTAGLFV